MHYWLEDSQKERSFCSMMNFNCVQPVCKNPTFLGFSSSSFLFNTQSNPNREATHFKCFRNRRYGGKRGGIVCSGLFPVDPWSPTIDSQSIASQLFAFSLFPYIGFLYFITKSKSAPKLTLFGFYFLLAFVGATTKVKYGTSLSNVDWLHGGAESLLTLTNLFIVMGLREALRKSKDVKSDTSDVVSSVEEEKNSSV
ncbi:hypothetical protein RHGRI_019930 [Rhododendron griersonianum]|uniref:Transmembrane protein n=1 Tax=Rhododendron griersonianum TaxID=479676 RepID=A0AAV6JHZ2_9ERIC|nr:hypothetical protein RHGRI_019930 [Rhododendron griersonianum]